MQDSPSVAERLRPWLMASRIPTLPASLVPVVTATACANYAGHVRWLAALAAMVGGLLIQIGTNVANDVMDFERGADTSQRMGPIRVTQAGLISPRHMRIGAVVIFSAAVLGPGAYLLYVAGWPVIAIGVLSILAGLAYTGGPYPLAYHGLGDLFVIIFFGLVAVLGTVYVELGQIPAIAWPVGLATGLLSTGLLVVNNLRDIPSDARTGKRTLAVILGRRATLVEYDALLVAAFATSFWLWALTQHSPWSLLPLAAFPLALWRMVTLVAADDAPSFFSCLKGTAVLLLAYCLLCCVGLTLAAA
jgi:1,4-dihydroxy-2-naphthoate polyprenyltransferase